MGKACDEARELLSAHLDGEADPAPAEAHLAGCAECGAWWERTQGLSRLTRTIASLPVPGLTDDAVQAILNAAPSSSPGLPVPRLTDDAPQAIRGATPDTAQPQTTAQPKDAAQLKDTAGGARSRVARVLRGALLVIGLAQFLLGVAQISNYASVVNGHVHADGVPVSSGHLWHESAAWNVAIGAALAWLAWRRTRPASLLPVMTAFVVVLTLLTLNDAVADRVEAGRVVSHSLVLCGYLLLLALHHPKLRDQTPPGQSVRPPGRWSLPRDGGEGDGPIATVHPFPVRVQRAEQVTVEQRRRAV